MTPAVKLIRTLLFLPVKEAMLREQRVVETERVLERGRRENEAVRGLVNQSAVQLRETYDQLLERTKWPS
jgi:hypothetical protein